MNTENYVTKSLEQHLFFGRIMKEHALFLRAGFTPANSDFSNKAQYYNNEFHKILSEAVTLSEGNVESDVLCSGELVTEFTVPAEKKTAAFTGIPINSQLTERQLNMKEACQAVCANNSLALRVRRLNLRALSLLDGFICFKELVLKNVLSCRMFTANYPLLIEHIIREAKLYRKYIEMLQTDGCLNDQSVRETECFWNQIMMEHALFIRGLLDPCETKLIAAANGFADDYSVLLETCHSAHSQTLPSSALEQTVKFRDFKAAGAKGINQCEIRSVILPLLADHVLREANHYIRLLK